MLMIWGSFPGDVPCSLAGLPATECRNYNFCVMCVVATALCRRVVAMSEAQRRSTVVTPLKRYGGNTH